MEENTAAVECLILYYINTKHVLKTKQLDERVFLDQMIKHCKESGFDYSNEEIRSTWKNLTLKYVELRKTGTVEDKESWKYYEILDSCFEQSDFHNGVYPKFSEEMVWFLIECFLKRKALEKTHRRHNILSDIHKDFLHNGYLYITRQDIENKWKYLNFKYDKLQDDPEALAKLPYLQAIKGFREKGPCVVKMIFTRELTEILIERFTEKKITCVIHGYDSEQVLSEIQSEFRELGFDFTQEEIKERWRKLTNIYSFLKAKGKHDSPWIYFNAMKEHFKDDFLFELGKFEKELKEERKERQQAMRQRSKSVDAVARSKRSRSVSKSKLVVNIEQLDEQKIPPKKVVEEKKPLPSKRKRSPKKSFDDDIDDFIKSPKKSRVRPKSRDRGKGNKSKSEDAKSDISEVKSTRSLRNHRLKSLSIDRNGNQERRSSADIGSPGSKVHIINIDESKIDKESGNLTINLPSITKQFSDNEFLPFKKRLRLSDEKTDKSNSVEDGFLGFPSGSGRDTKQTKVNGTESKQLTEADMDEIMKRFHSDKTENYDTSPNNKYYNSSDFEYHYQTTYNNFNSSCLVVKEEQDNVPVQNYSSKPVTPPPVLLLVIKVDGSNNAVKDEANPEGKKESESPVKSAGVQVKNNLTVKSVSPKDTVIKSETTVSANARNFKSELTKETKSVKTKDNANIRNNTLVKVVNPTTKTRSMSLNKQPKEIQKPKETVVTAKNFIMGEKKEPVEIDPIPFVASESVIPAVPQETNSTKIRLPVKGGGNVKEIFISPGELKKLAKIKPGDFKPSTSPTKANDAVVKNTLEVAATPRVPPKFKFISQVVKPPFVPENKPEKVFTKPKSKAESATELMSMLPPPTVVTSNAKSISTISCNLGNRKNEEFETESVFSEVTVDDEKDNLLSTVIDFQEQNNQEFVEIKNLMKQNNLLQRETNRLLRLMMEKM